MKCPWAECGYVRQQTENCPEWQCPACKNAYNKHPDYSGNNYYTIQLTYKEIPDDRQITAGTLFLYLNNNVIEGACLDKNNKIDRINLPLDDLKLKFNEIIDVLNNPPSLLNDEQEAAIFKATAIKINQDIEILVEQDNRKNFIYKLIILSICIGLISVLIFNYIDSAHIKTQGATGIQTKSNAPDTTQNMLQNSEINETNLIANGINLDFMVSKLGTAESLAKQCENICQSQHIKDSSCDKVNDILNTLSPQITQYRKYMQINSIDKLSANSQNKINQINQLLWSIPNTIDSAQNFCSENPDPKITTEPYQVNQDKLDLASKGLHLDILYSRLYTADSSIRNCRISCESHLSSYNDCAIFIKIYNESAPQLQQLFDILHSQRDKISSEDNRYIQKIIYLLEDIKTERTKTDNCIKSR